MVLNCVATEKESPAFQFGGGGHSFQALAWLTVPDIGGAAAVALVCFGGNRIIDQMSQLFTRQLGFPDCGPVWLLIMAICIKP